MSEVGAPRHDPIPIGEVADAAIRRGFPIRSTLFAPRARRACATLARRPRAWALSAFPRRRSPTRSIACRMVSPDPDLPGRGRARARARIRHAAARPRPLHRRCRPSTHTLDRLLALAAEHRDAGRGAQPRSRARRRPMTPRARRDGARGARRCRSRSKRSPSTSSSPRRCRCISRAWRRALTPKALVPVGDGAVPGLRRRRRSPSMVVGWPGAHGARFCACSLCGDPVELRPHQMHAVWLDPGHRLPGDRRRQPATVKAETCESCRGYVKILQQHKNPAVDPVADDVASLGLDLLVREIGYRRGGVNPFLLGY